MVGLGLVIRGLLLGLRQVVHTLGSKASVASFVEGL